MPNTLNIASVWCFWQYLWLSSIHDHHLLMHPSKRKLSRGPRSVCPACPTATPLLLFHVSLCRAFTRAPQRMHVVLLMQEPRSDVESGCTATCFQSAECTHMHCGTVVNVRWILTQKRWNWPIVSPDPLSYCCSLGQTNNLLTVLQWQLQCEKPCPMMFLNNFGHRRANIQVGIKYAMEG